MRENRILYQVKSLNKLVVRYFTKDEDFITKVKKEKINSALTPTQMEIIEYIKENENKEIYQKDLENVLNLRRATVSGVLQTMEKNGILERITHPSDARAKRIILNKNAERLFNVGEHKVKELESIITKNISVEDISIFSSVLNKMINNLKEEKERRE
jgi:MarR family transcriptional regulator, repressor for mepA